MNFLSILLISLSLSAAPIKQVQQRSFSQQDKSVFKIYSQSKSYSMVATGFLVRYNEENLIITNNHVCRGFTGVKSYILEPIAGSNGKRTGFTGHKVIEAFMAPNTDVCIVRAISLNRFTPLKLSKRPIASGEHIYITGYIGRSYDIMISDGWTYGSETFKEVSELKSCSNLPFYMNKQPHSVLVCRIADKFATYSDVEFKLATASVGPGYSGSPVINENDEVVGIVSRYVFPTTIDPRGDAIFAPVDHIIKALETSKFEKINTSNFIKKAKNIDLDHSIRQKEDEIEKELDNTLRELKEYYEHE